MHAASLADEIQSQFGNKIDEIETNPSDNSGIFDVFLNDELVYSKFQTGRHPHPGEVEEILMERLKK